MKPRLYLLLPLLSLLLFIQAREAAAKNAAFTGSTASTPLSTDGGKPAEKDTKKPPAPAPAQEYPTAKSVPGKPGFVYSPYVITNGMIDVREMKPGQKVMCPYTQKVFLVP